MKPWGSVLATELRSRRFIDDEEDEVGGLGDFEEDDEFEDELDEDELDDEDLDEDDYDEGYDDLDEDFDDEDIPRRGGGRPRRDWGE
ncbi:MAG TPA: hypothetical protein VNL98_03050 [Gemmatimonadales bacterium]|nr:hypothetical protein [Gemmatimonadales bacterium]